MSDTAFSDVLPALKLFADYDRPWAVWGGWAIDLFLNHMTRAHKDVDFAVLRKDQFIIHEHLSSRGGALEKAIKGQLIRWQLGEWIDLPVHTIWCKNSGTSPDSVELLFNEVDDANFMFRRNLSITLPVEKMILSSSSAIPILAPEIVLFYKSTNADDPSAATDFKNVLPKLSSETRDWFATALEKFYADHVWLKDLL